MIAAIELAVLARLRESQDALGFAWQRLETLPEDWEAYLDRKRGELRGPAAAWIVFTGWSNATREDEQLFVDGSFGLVVAHFSARPDEAANRHGGPIAASEPGLYRIALGAAAVLGGQMLGLDLRSPIEVGACEPLPRGKAMVSLNMIASLIDLTCRFPIQLAGEEPGPIEALHVNWDIPAFGQPVPVDRDLVAPGVQLPDDAHADATDHLVLNPETDPS